ncbi:MAG: RND family transporter [Desulfobacteraceae bacterium]|nr:RND family transporter [Desulfobacteraceae bacterium]
MSKMRYSIEKAFENLARVIYRNRLKTLFVMFMVFGALASMVADLSIDTSTEEMLHSEDPARIKYDEFKSQFGDTSLILIMITPPDIFESSFLEKLKRFHRSLEDEVPYIEEVTSLLNIRSTRGEGDTVHVDGLLEGWPEKTYDLGAVKNIARNIPLYTNHILSKDRKSTAIILKTDASAYDPAHNRENEDDMSDDSMGDDGGMFSGTAPVNAPKALSPDENALVFDAVNRLIKRYENENFQISFTGGPVVVDVFNRTTDKDMKKFSGLTTLMIILFLVILFRRISGVILPLIVVNMSMFSTLGLMVLTGTPISMMTTVIPSFLIAVGIADSVHVLAIFYRKYQEGKSKEDAIAYALGHSGLAVAMTSLTTSAGLLSFSFAEISTIADMGIYAAAGVVLALLYTIILMPALVAVVPVVRKKANPGEDKVSFMDRILLGFAGFSTSHPIKIVIFSLICFVVSMVYISRLEFSSNLLTYFPPDHEVRKDLGHVEDKFEGSITVEIIVDTKKEDGLQDPAILKSLERVSNRIMDLKNGDVHVGKVFSIVDVVKETNQALHGNDPDYYSIPRDRAQVAQELMLFQNSKPEDLEKITDSRLSKARVTINTKWVDSVLYEDFVDHLEMIFEKEFQGRAEVIVTGLSALLARTIPAALHSMMESYYIAFCIITILMLVLVGDIKLGLLSMAPNLLPIIMVMGLISAFGINLDINTLFIGSVAIGLVVDDTIHFMYNYKKYYDSTGNPVLAVEKTLLGTGRALLITSVVLAANFFVITTATLNHSIRFGLFTGIVVILALLADFVLAPALMVLASAKEEAKSVSQIQGPVIKSIE